MFLTSENTRKKTSQFLCTITTLLQSLRLRGTPNHITTQQPSGVPYLNPHSVSSKKTSCNIISFPIDHPSGIPSVAMSVYISTFPNITPTTLPSFFSKKTIEWKSKHFPLQDLTGLTSLVPSIQTSELKTCVTIVYICFLLCFHCSF